MFIATKPTLRLRWLGRRPSHFPGWFADDEWVPAGRKELYAYGRTGLYAYLDCLDETDATVLVPAYIPESAAWPFREAGYDVRYYPISETLSYPAGDVAARIREVRPDVVLFVHYLGFADPNFRRLVDVARDVGAAVIEDCSRGVFSRDADGRLLGSTGDAALYSLHKTLPAPHGGLLVTESDEPTPPVNRLTEVSDAVTLTAMAAVDRYDARPVVRSLNGNSTYHSFEYYYGQRCDPPSEAWPPTFPGVLSRTGLARTSPAAVQRSRRERYDAFRARLASFDELTPLTPEAHDGASPYGVAVRLTGGHERRERLYHALRRRGLPVERYIWPLEEGRDILEEFPESYALRSSTLVFPTHQQIPDGTADRLASALASELGSLARSESGNRTAGR